MNQGERAVTRTKAAIKTAFKGLLHRKNYADITVNEITSTGNVGRSTFYKHYGSKADVLIDIHTDLFALLLSGFESAESWLSTEPPGSMVSFLERFMKQGVNPFSLSYKLGNDLDYVMGRIDSALGDAIQCNLIDFFHASEASIPLPVLSQSIASLYIGLVRSWFSRFQSIESRDYVTHMHHLAGALIRETLIMNKYKDH